MIVEVADRLKSVEEYYFSKKLGEIDALNAAGKSIINLGIGKPDLAPAAEIINTLRDESLDPTAHGYQSYKGIPALRTAIADFYSRYFAVELDSETEILPLIGSKEGVMHISMAFLNEGDEVMIPDPGYLTYASATKLAGGKLVKYDLLEENRYQLDLDQLDRLATPRTKILWINYPHMPTGAKADRETYEKLIFWAKARKILIASDTPYSFILNEDRHSIMSIEGAKDVCIELNSLSKSHGMSGWRVGMAVSSKEIIDAVLRFKSNMDSGMFRPIQEAAITALNIGTNWYKANNLIYTKRRQIIWDLLDKIDFSYDKNAVGLFVWSKISDRFKNGEEASQYLLDHARVFIPPGIIFGANGDQYVRWSLCQDEYRIDEACRRINSVINL